MYEIFNDLHSNTKVTTLLLDKNIYLIVYAKQAKEDKPKPYAIGIAIFAKTELVTFTFADTIHFIEELNLFEGGNNQNKYFDVVERMQTKNLRLKLKNGNNIYITKSEAKAICKIFSLILSLYSLLRITHDAGFPVTQKYLLDYLNNFILQYLDKSSDI